MFIKANRCPICFAPWKEDNDNCLACGSIAELYFERPLPSRQSVDEAKLEQTIERVRAYLVDHENHGLARYTLGLSYANLGLLPEAQTEIKRATQLMPEKFQIAYEAAVTAAKQGDFSEDVLDVLNRVIDRKPDFKEALYLQGVVLKEQGRLNEAVRAWQSAYELDNEYAPAEEWLRRFVRGNEILLRSPDIVASVRKSAFSQNAIDYLDLVNIAEPVKPPPLGLTSMSVLETLSPTKAKLMRRMYTYDVQRYDELRQQRSTKLQMLAKDVISMSELCLAATKAQAKLAAIARASTSSVSPNSGEATARQLSLAERSQILDQEVMKYQRNGYTLVSRTETTAQLSKKHEFSFCLAFFLVLIVIGIILYLLYYLIAKKEHLILLEVDELGRIHATHS